MSLKNVKPGDYIAAYSGRGDRAKAIMCTEVRKVNTATVDCGNGNLYRIEDGKAFSYKVRGEWAEKVPKAFHDQFVADRRKEEEDRKKREAEFQAKENKPEVKLSRWIHNEVEFRADAVRKLSLWRLEMAKIVLNTEMDDMATRAAILEMVP
jgi:hypothetical protein